MSRPARTGAIRGEGHVLATRGIPARLANRLIWAGFAAGLLLMALLVARSQVGGDQLNLLARGWLLAVRGRMVWTGNPLSTGGNAPGGLTSLLVGLPLMLWRDHRAATALVALCHLLAFLVLDRTLARILSPQERLCFMILYWLSPWQLYFAGFLWNPNYLFLGGAIHLATAWRLRGQGRPRGTPDATARAPGGPPSAASPAPNAVASRLPTEPRSGAPRERATPSAGASLLHVATLVLAFQVHPSFLLLAAASALLWWRGYIRLHLPGALAGAALGALPLVPWAVQVAAHPALLAAAHKGFPGRGLVYSLPRGLFYWLRYSSLAVAGRTSLFDFTEAFGTAANRRLAPPLRALTEVVGPLTVLLPLAANLWLARRWWRQRASAPRRSPAPPTAEPAGGRAWLRAYVVATLVAAAAVFALSPTTLMYWQGLCLFHAAVLPLTLYAGALLRTRHARRVLAAAAVYVALGLMLTLGIAFGTPDFRCRGLGTLVFPLRDHSPMLDDLHIQSTCPWPLDVPGTWWPDVLPPSAGDGLAVYEPPQAAMHSW